MANPAPDSYLDIGHDAPDAQPWWINRGEDDINYGRRGRDHRSYPLRAGGLSGRIDHKRKAVSITQAGRGGSVDPDRLEYVRSLLSMDYPEYRLMWFPHTRKPPTILPHGPLKAANPAPEDYFDVGHFSPEEARPWAIEEGDSDIAYGKMGEGHFEFFEDQERSAMMPGSPKVTGRIDYALKQISVAAPLSSELAKYAVTILKVDFPDFDIWQFGEVMGGIRLVYKGKSQAENPLGFVYHMTSDTVVKKILEEGLKVGQTGGYTREGAWADDYYGIRPIYVSTSAVMPPYAAGRLLEIDASGLELVADMPSLVDFGAQLDLDAATLYWTPDSLPALMDDDDFRYLMLLMTIGSSLPIQELITPSIISDAAIALTKTAVVLEDIPPERLRVAN